MKKSQPPMILKNIYLAKLYHISFVKLQMLSVQALHWKLDDRTDRTDVEEGLGVLVVLQVWDIIPITRRLVQRRKLSCGAVVGPQVRYRQFEPRSIQRGSYRLILKSVVT